MSEALFNSDDIIEVNADTLAELKRRRDAAPRGRFRLCLHHDTQDPVQEMLIVCGRGTYFRPHRHPAGKSESVHVVEGTMTIYVFDDLGNVVRRVRLGDGNSGESFLYRLSASVWHLPLPTSETLVYHEVSCGPFSKDGGAEYAPWSPAENDPAVDSYLQTLETGTEP